VFGEGWRKTNTERQKGEWEHFQINKEQLMFCDGRDMWMMVDRDMQLKADKIPI
jgi:hypothetical protein